MVYSTCAKWREACANHEVNMDKNSIVRTLETQSANGLTVVTVEVQPPTNAQAGKAVTMSDFEVPPTQFETRIQKPDGTVLKKKTVTSQNESAALRAQKELFEKVRSGRIAAT